MPSSILPQNHDEQELYNAISSFLKIAKFNSTIHLYSGILFCTSGV